MNSKAVLFWEFDGELLRRSCLRRQPACLQPCARLVINNVVAAASVSTSGPGRGACVNDGGSSICSTSGSIAVSNCCAFLRILSFDDLVLQAQTFILKMIWTNVIDTIQSHDDQIKVKPIKAFKMFEGNERENTIRIFDPLYV